MRDILTVTLNPALDLATKVGAVVPNVKLRCEPARLDPGGGGINVSRAVQILGGSPAARPLPAGRTLLTGGLSGVREFAPHDLYVTAGGGTPVAELQAFLAHAGYQAALLSPWAQATLGGLLSANLNAPLRMRYGGLRDQALAGNSLFGPASGDLVEGAGVIQGIFPEIETTNFYARATFTNPQDLGVPYEVGFGIRHVEGNNQLRLTVTTDDVWSLGIGDQPAYQTGKAYKFQSEADEQNTIELVADGETGYLAINGMVVAVLDLSPSLSSGDVWVAAGLNAPSIVSGRTSTVTDFQIWGLP